MILIIVKSPTKARSISRYAREFFQKKNVVVRSSLGHLRDLPDSRLGVDVKSGFAPEYEILREKQKTVRTLRPIIRQAERIILAADPDREGEAVAWHVTKIFAEELKGKLVQRVVFHAITRAAVHAGLRTPTRTGQEPGQGRGCQAGGRSPGGLHNFTARLAGRGRQQPERRACAIYGAGLVDRS